VAAWGSRPSAGGVRPTDAVTRKGGSSSEETERNEQIRPLRTRKPVLNGRTQTANQPILPRGHGGRDNNTRSYCSSPGNPPGRADELKPGGLVLTQHQREESLRPIGVGAKKSNRHMLATLRISLKLLL